MRKFLFNVMLFCGAICVSAQGAPEKLPIDPEVRYGRLDNGLTYYIRHNDQPRQRAEFHFAQLVGANLEEDNQNGFTHFLEHMAFNSTQHFKGKNIINYFESVGVNFGSDINAYTSQDESVYRISNVPTYREGIIDSALLVMYDWSCGMSLSSEEIDAERGVILEEWRTRRADKRVMDQLNAEMYPGSRYAARNIIGDTSVIANFKHQSLRDYYKKWYRPDNQAIIVVGDIDVDKIESKIEALWGKIPRSSNWGNRPIYSITHNEEPLVVVLSDMRTKNSRIIFEYKFDQLPESFQGTAQEYMLNIVRELVCNMMDNRLSEIASDSKASFSQANCQYSRVAKNMDAFCTIAVPKLGRETDAFNDLYSQLKRMQRSGFTNTELERAKREKLASIKKDYNERGTRKSIALARECIRHFEDGKSMPGLPWEYEFVEAVLPMLTLDQINGLAESLIHPNPTIAFVTQTGKNVDLPSKETILATITGKAAPKSTQPPLLAIQEGSLIFKDESNNNIINATELCYINFKIKNSGKGDASDCEARIRLSGTTSGINVSAVKLGKITPGQSYDVSIPIRTNSETRDGKVSFNIEIYEPNGWGIAPFDLTVVTKAFEKPYLQVVDYNIASNSGKIRKMEPFTLIFNLQNTKYGDAEEVRVKVNLPTNVFVMDGSAELSYPLIKSGETKSIQLTLAANNNYPTTNIPITIDIKEKHGKFAENKQLDIALNQSTSSSINIAAKDEPQQERKEIKIAMLKSEVDRNIPITNSKSPNTFVLIIANEHYSHVSTVPFALNDGNIFREYCIKTLGIGDKHIKHLSDATGNDLKSGVNWLAKITEAFDNPQIIVYYAGHGIPDESSKSAYLLPVDGNGSDITTGYKLDNLYSALGSMPASQITVFMDACFSGSKREEGMLASARGVALKAKSGVPQGNMVVFSAAQGDETAYPNREQQHGLFTYYLLKKLQETSGDIALKDLGDYITKQVSQQSLLVNDKKQTPCVTPSATIGNNWQNWKLK